MDGNYSRTIEVRLRECDTVFLFDLPVNVCLAGVESRIGMKRDDMPWMDETLDEECRQWIVDLPNKVLPQIYDLFERYKNEKKMVIFKSRKEFVKVFVPKSMTKPAHLHGRVYYL